MQDQIHGFINEMFYDLQACCREAGERLCSEGLADAVCDRMHDENAEYRAMPYNQRRAMVLKICRQYV